MQQVPQQKITTFLMFDGQAGDAMNFYVSLFPDGEVLSLVRYGADGPGVEGTIEHAAFSIAGQQFMCSDSNVKQSFGFTPSMSLYIECETADEMGRLYDAVAAHGELLMPLDSYGFSTRFAWVQDRYGVSWQLNLK